MFSKIHKTVFPPKDRPIMVWDGACDFCNYWIINWKSKTGDRIIYKTFQEVAGQFADIPLKEFKKASRLIKSDGSVYSGPDSAFRTFQYFKNPSLSWHLWYSQLKAFTILCDYSYNFIAKNRSFMFKVTKIFFGKNPENIKPYWLFLLLIIFTVAFLLFRL
ncbi:thiol-disulfide oxidoreductase DCC family protein [Aequorivita capsosiphonis]|uniref:thiol-disulfide oxidoreductase DCC family protein n=1 Tax=Aequorivita capsosiphonis TaxID=487317 RepID=UPI00047B8DF4|nr:DCC1-like thiol-disulfide oxidoreductase family protein [Aequorivita capsosiphonis]